MLCYYKVARRNGNKKRKQFRQYLNIYIVNQRYSYIMAIGPISDQQNTHIYAILHSAHSLLLHDRESVCVCVCEYSMTSFSDILTILTILLTLLKATARNLFPK